MNSLNQSTIFSRAERILLPIFASAILSGAPSGSQAEEITHDTVARVESTIGKDTLI